MVCRYDPNPSASGGESRRGVWSRRAPASTVGLGAGSPPGVSGFRLGAGGVGPCDTHGRCRERGPLLDEKAGPYWDNFFWAFAWKRRALLGHFFWAFAWKRPGPTEPFRAPFLAQPIRFVHSSLSYPVRGAGGTWGTLSRRMRYDAWCRGGAPSGGAFLTRPI